MLLSQAVPNLINGVSQQAEALRFPAQCAEQENFFPTVLRGLSKRPPTNHVKVLSGADFITGYQCAAHKIDRSAEHRYQAYIGSSGIRVFDLEGNEKTVNAPGGYGYLAGGDPTKDIRTLPVADYTFVLNTTKVVTASAQSPATTRTPEALVFVKQVRDGANYKIKLFNSPTNGTPDHTVNVTDVKLGSGSTFTGPLVADQGDVITNLGVALDAGPIAALYSHQNDGELLYIKKHDGSDFRIEIECSIADGMAVFKDSVQSFALLPKRGWANFRIKVKGDPDEDGDDYYLKFVPQDANTGGFGEGFWEETQAPGLNDDVLNAATMPHALVRNGDGTFTFGPLTWASRRVGDQESNPAPSFVGYTITNLLFRKNRLGFLTRDNYVLSEAGEFFNFWRTTVLQLLDSDVIDVASGHPKSGDLVHSCATTEKLVLFSAQAQFVPDEGELLTPKTLGLKEATPFPFTVGVAPQAIGDSIFFPFSVGSFSGVIDYAIAPDTGVFAGEEITEHCPNYIRGPVRQMAASESNVLALLATPTNTLYLYKFFKQERRRVQSSWSKLTFDGTIRSFHFFGSRLYLTLLRGSQHVLEYVDLTPGLKDTKPDGNDVFVTHLDRRVTEASCTVSYNSGLDRTSFTLPYTPVGANVRVASRGTAYGSSITVQSVAGSVVTVNGNYSAEPVWIGEVFTSRQVLTRPSLREARSDGSYTINTGRFQVRTGTITADESLDFRVEVTPKGRATFAYSFAARVLGTSSSISGQPLEPRSAPMRFTVNSKNDQVTVALVNDTYLPCNLISLDWEALYVARAQRV